MSEQAMTIRPRAERVIELGELACLDLDRASRTGIPEVVFAESKTTAQTFAILAAMRAANPAEPAFATRCPPPVLAAAVRRFPAEAVLVDKVGRTVMVGQPPGPSDPARSVAVVTAGTSDLPTARECLSTLEFLGVGGYLVPDVGIAGIGRLLAKLPAIRTALCIVAVAGMEGALASVLAGLVAAPIIGVPTSIGYGISADGVVAAAAMLASCSPGLVAVNVDNGFGAAVHAAKVIKAIGRTDEPA
jgi:pyridinium-3,5-biscarboxylic acid mononucleotide synthase